MRKWPKVRKSGKTPDKLGDWATFSSNIEIRFLLIKTWLQASKHILFSNNTVIRIQQTIIAFI